MSYSNIWSNTEPLGTVAANSIDNIFRSLKVDITERLDDIFAMPTFVTDPLRPYGLKFTDAADAIVSLGDNAGTPRSILIKDKAGAITYYTLASTGFTTSGLIKSTGATGIGYATGAGGSVTQATNKSTAVTLNKICGKIIMNGATLVAGVRVAFTFNNSTIAAGDTVLLSLGPTGTVGVYNIWVDFVSAGLCVVYIKNVDTNDWSDAVTINFAVIKAVTS